MRYWDGESREYGTTVAYTCGKGSNFVSEDDGGEMYERAYRDCRWDGTWDRQGFDECRRK